MKIWRVRTEEGITWAASDGDESTLRRLEGTQLGEFSSLEETLEDYQILAPVVPPLILAVGQNYRAHAAEMGAAVSEFPTIFMKSPATVIDPGTPIQLPRCLRSDEVDYEGELAIVIGRRCRNATLDDALHHVLGFTIANDVTARDWQKKWGGGQFCRGKSFDTFCPLGPCIETVDAIGDPGNLRVRTWVNGELRQDGSTADLITRIPELIVFLSGSTTLPAGTVILTGTPSGVGAARQPATFLQPDDVVEIEIDGIGRLTNPVIAEPL